MPRRSDNPLRNEDELCVIHASSVVCSIWITTCSVKFLTPCYFSLRRPLLTRRYNLSVFIRQKLENIERLATPVGSLADAQEQRLRLARAARRHALRDGSVRLFRVPEQCSPFVASGLIAVTPVEIPVRDLLQKAVPEGEEYILSLGDAARLTDDLEDCYVRILANTLEKDPGYKSALSKLAHAGLLREAYSTATSGPAAAAAVSATAGNRPTLDTDTTSLGGTRASTAALRATSRRR